MDTRTANRDDTTLANAWAMIAGAVLVLVGILGFFPNPLVGGEDAFLTTDALHNIIHIGTGILALLISTARTADAKSNALIGFGILYAAIFVLVFVSPDLFGLFAVPANGPLHVIHAALALVSLALGFMTRGEYRTARA